MTGLTIDSVTHGIGNWLMCTLCLKKKVSFHVLFIAFVQAPRENQQQKMKNCVIIDLFDLEGIDKTGVVLNYNSKFIFAHELAIDA